jgi:hypothetical protein
VLEYDDVVNVWYANMLIRQECMLKRKRRTEDNQRRL